jgi:hypothetical protein
MLLDSNQQALRAAGDFFRAGQPLAAAIVYGELAQGGLSTPELWCGLGSALMASRGVMVRAPFEAWAAKVFRRGAPAFPGTPYAEVALEWLTELPQAKGTAPLDDAEIPAMLAFLLVNERVLPDAAAALPEDAMMGTVMALGDRKSPLYLPVLRDAVEGKLGAGAARSALKRIGPFLERPEMLASLLAAKTSPEREELEPYLSFVTDRLPPGWDAPRTAACPAYEGVSRIDIELVDAGPRPTECLPILVERLSASERDARSWLDHAPCMMKRAATRDDALRLESALSQLGAKVTLHDRSDGKGGNGGNGAREKAPPAGPEEPWWKFW